MKQINRKILPLFGILLFIFIGCTKNFEDINEDPNQPIEVPTSYLFTNG